MHHIRSRRLAGAVVGAALLSALAVPVSAHVSIIDGSAVHGGGHGTQITFRVPHGCDGAASDTVEVQVPDGVTGVKPKWLAGWTIETEPRAAAGASVAPDPSAEPVEPEVGVVRWTGGPLPDGQYLDFQMLAVFPETPGEVYFPVVQRCGDDEVAWIEIPAEGQTEDDLDDPAPAVTVVEGGSTDDD
jgi:uncharacterized protein YcnI